MTDRSVPDDFDEALSRLNDTPPDWTPAPDDVLVGTVHQMGKRSTKYGDKRVMVVMGRDGNLVTVWLHAVLKREVDKNDTREGDVVALHVAEAFR